MSGRDYAITSLKGERATQQDDALALIDVFSTGEFDCFVVLDGHGQFGDIVASKVKNLLIQLLPEFKSTLPNGFEFELTKLFSTIQSNLEEEMGSDLFLSGTCISLCLINQYQILVGNLGDCRIVIARQPKEISTKGPNFIPICLTSDHTCSDPLERSRIEKSGGRVSLAPGDDAPDAPLRIYKGTLPYPGLVTSRALGDTSVKSVGVITQPSITIHTIDPLDKFLILATDGVWDGLTNSQTAHLISTFDTLQTMSDGVTKKALKYLKKKNLGDNCTCIIVKL